MNLDEDMLEFYSWSLKTRPRYAVPKFNLVVEHRSIETFSRAKLDEVEEHRPHPQDPVPAHLFIEDVTDTGANASEQKPITIAGGGFVAGNIGIRFGRITTAGDYYASDVNVQNPTLLYCKTPVFPAPTTSPWEEYHVTPYFIDTGVEGDVWASTFKVTPDPGGGGGGGGGTFHHFAISPDGFVTVPQNVPYTINAQTLDASNALVAFNGSVQVWFLCFQCYMEVYPGGTLVTTNVWTFSGNVTFVNGLCSFYIAGLETTSSPGSFQLRLVEPSSGITFDSFNFTI